MDISIITPSPESFEVKELLKAATKFKLEANVLNFSSWEEVKIMENKIGGVIIWRGSSLGGLSVQKQIFLKTVKPRQLVNIGLVHNTQVQHKLYQYSFLQKYTDVSLIKTNTYFDKSKVKQAIVNKELEYPFIMKASFGSEGKGVFLIKRESELPDVDYSKFIFQPFIQNNGDYRVFIVGGKIIGIMKRIAPDGEFLNNIAQGGTAELVDINDCPKELCSIALASASGLGIAGIAGVDIMFDENTKRYIFVEINTVPSWSGLQKILKVNIAEEIVKNCVGLLERKNNYKGAKSLVKKNYDESLEFLQNKRFHYLSRMYGWTKDEMYLKHLLELKDKYLHGGYDSTKSYLEEIHSGKIFHNFHNNNYKFINLQKERAKYIEKYKNIFKYSDMLFMSLYSMNWYQIGISDEVKEVINKKEVVNIYNELINDQEAIAYLSTFAVNFIYLVKDFFGINFDPKQLINVYKNILDKTNIVESKLAFYILTHAIIGESKFYRNSVEDSDGVYFDMLRLLEAHLNDNYSNISLDNKFEFLVVAKLCAYKSNLEKIILSEANNSLSPHGNYLVDTLNAAVDKSKHSLILSEHRNVLFLMSQLSFEENSSKIS